MIFFLQTKSTKRIQCTKRYQRHKDSFKPFFFFHDKILHAQNHQKKTRHQKALKVQKHNQTKAQKRKKVKNKKCA